MPTDVTVATLDVIVSATQIPSFQIVDKRVMTLDLLER
jgi:hypothetical protein